MTTTMTTQRTEDEVLTDVERRAAELRAGDRSLSEAQAFTEVLRRDRGLFSALARARQAQWADAAPPADSVEAACARIAADGWTLAAIDLRTREPQLTDAAARVKALERSPALRRLVAGR